MVLHAHLSLYLLDIIYEIQLTKRTYLPYAHIDWTTLLAYGLHVHIHFIFYVLRCCKVISDAK